MPPVLGAATAGSNGLNDAFLAAAVYALVQWVIKPLIVSFWLPQSNPYQDNATRATGFLVAYGLTLVNAGVQQPLTWTVAWVLLPTAAGIYASSALVYHMAAPGAPSPAGTAPVAAEAAAGAAAGAAAPMGLAQGDAAAPALVRSAASPEVLRVLGALLAAAAAESDKTTLAAPESAPATPLPTPAAIAPAPPTAMLQPASNAALDPLTNALGHTVAPALSAPANGTIA